MNFDINGLIDMIEKRLGNFATNAFIAFVLFVVVAWLGAYIINDAFLPLLSGLGKISSKETDLWKIVHLLILSFLSLCGIGFLYVLSRNRSVTSEKLKEIRKILDTQKSWMKEFEDSKKKFNKIRELLDFLKKGKKEYRDINKRL